MAPKRKGHEAEGSGHRGPWPGGPWARGVLGQKSPERKKPWARAPWAGVPLCWQGSWLDGLGLAPLAEPKALSTTGIHRWLQNSKCQRTGV